MKYLCLCLMLFTFLSCSDEDELRMETFGEFDMRPIFNECETIIDKNDREQCSIKRLIIFVYSNLIYPEQAKANKTEGEVFIEFTVEESGEVDKLTIVEDIGDGCGEAALRIFEAMPNWTPGMLNGIPVSVRFIFPVRFRLEG